MEELPIEEQLHKDIISQINTCARQLEREETEDDNQIDAIAKRNGCNSL